MSEIERLHEYQERLTRDGARRIEIPAQATTADLTDLLRPLGFDDTGGFDATERLIRTVIDLTAFIAFHYKDRFARPRPNAVDPTLRPALGNPPHSAYPSAHSMQIHAVAEVLNRAVPELGGAPELYFVAARVAENREYAGLHYASDSEAGRYLAQWALPYLCEACRELMLETRREWVG